MPHKKCFSNTSPLCTSKMVTNPRILADKNRLIFLNIHELTLIWFCWHVHIHKMSPCRCLSFGSVFFLFFNSLVSQPNRVIRRYPGINICGNILCYIRHKDYPSHPLYQFPLPHWYHQDPFYRKVATIKMW